MVIPIQEPNAKACVLILLPLEGGVSRNHVFHEERKKAILSWRRHWLFYFSIAFLGHTSTQGLLGLFSAFIC